MSSFIFAKLILPYLPWSVPWPELALIAGVILLTTALSVRGPVRRLRALPIVETLTVQ